MVTFSSIVRAAFRAVGVELQRSSSVNYPPARRARIMAHERIEVVLDVGANVGQFAKELRQAGYGGRIISFEPLSVAYARLALEASNDPNWETRNIALGEKAGTARINVSENLASSSLLPASEDLALAAPEARTVGQETVQVVRLDEVLTSLPRDARRILLKLDVQGSEKSVLESAGPELSRLHAIQAEVALVPSYLGQATWDEMIEMLKGRGFHIVDIQPGFVDPASGFLRECDVMFLRRPQSGGQ